MNEFKKISVFLTSLILSIFITTTTNAQVIGPSRGAYADDMLGQGGASTGRSAGTVVDLNSKSYREMKRIRSLINEGKNDEAARRAITFIQTEERGRNTGVEPSPYYREAYNNLCVSSTALGKVEYAMDACNTSLELNPNHWESLKGRATIYFLTQNYESSLKDFQTALAHAPEDNKAISDVLKQNISVVQSKLK